MRNRAGGVAFLLALTFKSQQGDQPLKEDKPLAGGSATGFNWWPEALWLDWCVHLNNNAFLFGGGIVKNLCLKETDRDRQRESEREKQRETEGAREREREREREIEKEKEKRERERERERSQSFYKTCVFNKDPNSKVSQKDT